MYPNVDAMLNAVGRVTDEETRAFIWGNYPTFPEVAGVKAWALFTLSEHFRAGLAQINPDESDWPQDHREVLARLEKEAWDFVATLAQPPYLASLDLL